MCKCTPEIRTPFCGKPGCEVPKQPEKPAEIVTIENVLKLLVKMTKPTVDDSGADKAEISSVITSYEDGKKYKVTCIIEPL